MSARTLSLSISRRAFLTGLGAAALAPYLPLLNASGQEALFPKRLLLFFTPHGTITQAWKPTGSETDFKLGRLLAPLARHQSKLCVVSGVNMQDVGVGAPHTKGVPLLWTGSKLLDDGTFVRADGSGGPTYGWNASASVDHVIAERIGGATTFRSLEFGVRCGSSGPSNRIYSAAKQPLQPATDPWAQYDRLFTGGGEQVAPSAWPRCSSRAKSSRSSRPRSRPRIAPRSTRTWLRSIGWSSGCAARPCCARGRA
jgi:hypothetical protein